MPWNRPVVLAIALTAAVATAATSHAAPPLTPSEPPLSFADTMEQLAAVEKVPSDIANGAAAAARRTVPRPRHDGVRTVAERERPDRAGRNDTLERAQQIRRVGTGHRDAQDVRLAGALVELNAPPTQIGDVAEDDGAIPLANPTGLTAEQPSVRASAVIGDGPHGTSEGDGSGDFDFYRIDDAAADQVLTVDVDAAARGAELDAVVAVLADTGQILAFNDDSPELDSRQLRAARAASRRRLPRRRGRLRIAADEPVRLGQRRRRQVGRCLRRDHVVRVRRGRRRLSHRHAPR